MKRLLVLLLVFATIILNGIVFDVLQPSHEHGDNHDGEESHVSSSVEKHGDHN
jgi:hypothetical protein